MCRSLTVLFLLFQAVVTLGEDTVGGIKFPVRPTPIVVAPVIPSVVTPDVSTDTTPQVLEYGRFYVVESDEKFFLLASPSTIASVTYEEGPLKLRGIFVDGTGDIETRTYASKFIAIVDAKKDVTGVAELIAVPSGVPSEDKILRTLVQIGRGPRPPPVVVVPDEPVVDPTPDVPTGFRVILVYESSDKYPPETNNILFSTRITEYLSKACVKGPKDIPEWRKWDKDMTVTSQESTTLKALWEQSKPKFGTMPQLIIAVNGKASIVDLPPTEQETLDLLKKYGGQ